MSRNENGWIFVYEREQTDDDDDDDDGYNGIMMMDVVEARFEYLIVRRDLIIEFSLQCMQVISVENKCVSNFIAIERVNHTTYRARHAHQTLRIHIV